MIRQKRILPGILVLTLIFGFFAACDLLIPDEGTDYGYEITITGLNEYNDSKGEILFYNDVSGSPVAHRTGTVKRNILKVAMKEFGTDEDWKGQGNYFIRFLLDNGSGGSNSYWYSDDGKSERRYPVAGNVTSLPFSMFIKN